MSADDLWIVAIGGITAATCAWVGAFLMLRRMTALGDAVAHSILPGVVAAFLLIGQRSETTMYLGAMLTGTAATAVMEFLRSRGGMKPDAAIGVVFTGFFAVGIMLLTAFADNVDLDLECVLYGEIVYAPLDVWTIGGTSYGPKAFWRSLASMLFVVGVLILTYKELMVVSFDGDYAQSVGLSPTSWRYVLAALTAIAVVTALESVGVVLATAFLTALPAAAYLLTGRLNRLLALATLFGLASSGAGYAIAVALNVSVAGAMACAAGAIFLSAWAVAQRRD
ncbi:MAG: metal ABC transporter permease [Bacteroidia bacterium]|nr:metal ABC transporter permease [Bacteroidia bacterium]MDW8333730.1 metal ABC transporter permease [Bacteroidia bacterium]